MDNQQKHKILKGNVNQKCKVCSSLCFDCKMLHMCGLVPFLANFKYSKTILLTGMIIIVCLRYNTCCCFVVAVIVSVVVVMYCVSHVILSFANCSLFFCLRNIVVAVPTDICTAV